MTKRMHGSELVPSDPLDSLELWRPFADTVPDMLLLVSRDGTVRYINHPPPGVARAALLGTSAFDLAPAGARGELRAALESIFRGAAGRVRVQQALHPDGTERWYELHSGPVIVNREVAAAIIVARDVTETRRAEAALAESEARFRTLVEHAPEAIVVLDVDRGTFVDANQNACDLFGVSLEQLTRTDPVSLSPPIQLDGQSSHAAACKHIEAALAGEVPTFEWVHRTRFGRDVRCEVRLVLLPSAHRRLVRGSIIDVTERRRLEERLSEAGKMDALGQLAAGIAHDFNNMLAVVASSAQMILHDTEASHEIRVEADAVLEACRRGSALTSQLLTFARRERLPARQLDLNDVVRDIASLVSRVIDRRITLETKLDPNGARVCLNKSQLEQVIMNLVLNARDAQGGGHGTITISTRARLSTTSLRIADTGAGMVDEVRRRVFEPFFTTKSGSGGTGLGLSTVYAIVTKAGGSIEVESTPGLGSAFEILFPNGPAAETPANQR